MSSKARGAAIEPRIGGVAETVLYVRGLPLVRRFYEEVLGLDPLHATDRAVVLRTGDGQVLIIFEESTAWSERATEGGTIPAVATDPAQAPGRSHVAFRVVPESLEPWRARLAEHGLPVESHVVWKEGVESLYFRDPAGHLLELVTPGLWGE